MDEDCPVCLLRPSHPVELPCKHTFCFLCIKGVACSTQRKCPMCRTHFPKDVLRHPKVLNKEEVLRAASDGDGYTWYYEGSNGWWQYDERTCQEIEAAFLNKKTSCDVLIAGFIYTINFEDGIQYRAQGPGRRRQIKRDLITAEKKGVAGLLLNPPDDQNLSPETSDNESVTPPIQEIPDADHIRGLTVSVSSHLRNALSLYTQRIDSVRREVDELSQRLRNLGISPPGVGSSAPREEQSGSNSNE